MVSASLQVINPNSIGSIMDTITPTTEANVQYHQMDESRYRVLIYFPEKEGESTLNHIVKSEANEKKRSLVRMKSKEIGKFLDDRVVYALNLPKYSSFISIVCSQFFFKAKISLELLKVNFFCF